MTCLGGVAEINYYTWHYFGGEVVNWKVRIGPHSRVKRRVLVAGIGSYDYYH